MKTERSEHSLRRIASKDHNIYIAEGMYGHKATQVAPSSLLQPIEEKLQERIKTRHRALEKLLRQRIG